MKNLVCHTALGDEILLSGAVIKLARIHGQLRVPTYAQYLDSVRSFYVNHPEISVYEVANPPGSHWGCPPLECFDIQGEALLCGSYGDTSLSRGVSFPEWFYKQLGVDYSHRWDSCPIQKAWEKTGPQLLKTQLNFVHDDPARGFNITKGLAADIYRPTLRPIILQYAFAMAQARRLDVIDSAFLHLAESLDTFAELFWHRYARQYTPVWNDYPTRKKWTIVT